MEITSPSNSNHSRDGTYGDRGRHCLLAEDLMEDKAYSAKC